MSAKTYASVTALLFAIVLLAGYTAVNAQGRRPVDCSGRPNAPFVWGCSRYYSLCEREREVGMMCRRGELFRWKSGECEKNEKVPECANQEGHATTLHEGPPMFVCPEKDGLFMKNSCSVDFFECVAGRALKKVCGDDRTVFDVSQSACVWRNEVPECEAQPSGKEEDPKVEEDGHKSSEDKTAEQ